MMMSVTLFNPIKTYSQNTLFVGHRGASYLAPENTVAAYKLAWELGAEAAECDIMLTKDKQVILFHDKYGKRLTEYNFVAKDIWSWTVNDPSDAQRMISMGVLTITTDRPAWLPGQL